MQRDQYNDEYGFMVKLDPALKQALDEEMELLVETFTRGCTESEFDDAKMVMKKIKRKSLAVFKKVVSVNVTKRLLDVRTGLSIRVYFGKAPQRDQLDEFLKTKGVISLRKCVREKMFVATCSNYKAFDSLCAMKIAFIGDVPIRFKPLHVCEVPDKKLKRNAKAKKNKEFCLNEQDEDVILIENKKESIVLDDSESNENYSEEIHHSSGDLKVSLDNPENMKEQPQMAEDAGDEGDWSKDWESWDIGNKDNHDSNDGIGVHFTEDDLEDF